MIWGLEWGTQLDTLLQIYEASGKMPKALENRPSLDVRQQYYFTVFSEISSSRARDHQGNRSLTVLDVLAYCTFYGINDIEQRTTLARHIRALDKAYLTAIEKKKDTDKAVKS